MKHITLLIAIFFSWPSLSFFISAELEIQTPGELPWDWEIAPGEQNIHASDFSKELFQKTLGELSPQEYISQLKKKSYKRHCGEEKAQKLYTWNNRQETGEIFFKTRCYLYTHNLAGKLVMAQDTFNLLVQKKGYLFQTTLCYFSGEYKNQCSLLTAFEKIPVKSVNGIPNSFDKEAKFEKSLYRYLAGDKKPTKFLREIVKTNIKNAKCFEQITFKIKGGKLIWSPGCYYYTINKKRELVSFFLNGEAELDYPRDFTGHKTDDYLCFTKGKDQKNTKCAFTDGT